MEALQCADPKSFIPSAFSINMSNFKLTNVDASPCILKNESDSSRPVSIIFTRTPNGSNNYVHVLRCPACDLLTLILSTLREHVKANHPNIESITLLSCSQCGSMSTERNLLEEHMKLYHFNFETSTYKFLETRQAINSESTTTSLTIPLTISPPSATVGGLRIGLASPQPASTNSPSNSIVSCTTAQPAPPPQSSSPPIITSPQRSTSSSHASAQVDSISQAPERSAAIIQGSRRRKATTPGKIPAAALALNGEGEDIVEQVSKRIKLDKTLESNRDGAKTSGITLTKTPSHATMVCSMNGIMEALKNQQLANSIIENSTASTSSATSTATPTSKVTTAIMMDANSAKNLVNQILAAAAAGQGKIEVSGAGVTMSANAATATATHLSADQALDMSMRPIVELQQQQQLQAQMKTAELKLADLIQADQFNHASMALRTALSGAVMPSPPAPTPPSGTPGIQQITIGLPTTTPNQSASMIDSEVAKQLQNASQMISIPQLHAMLSAFTPVKATQTAKDSLSDVLSSQMLLQATPSLVTSSGVSVPLDGLSSSAISFSNAGLALASALAPVGAGNSLKGVPLSTGEFIPVTGFLPGQTGGLGSFGLTSGGVPNNLASFVTSLSGATATPTTITSTGQQQATPTTQQSQLPFEAALFASATGNPLSIASTSQSNSQVRTPAQSIGNGGAASSSTMVTAISRSNNDSPQVGTQGLRESTSCMSLEDLAADNDKSSLAIDDSGANEHIDAVTAEESGSSSVSNTGQRKPASGKSGSRRGGGVGSRPHRQNFTATQNRILTDWYNSHHYKPYPSTEDTKQLASMSDLTYSQVKKWFANKRARTSNNGLPKPLPPTAPDAPSGATTDTSAFVAAAVAAATAANQPNLLSANGTTSVMLQSQGTSVTTTASASNSILVPSGLMIRPNGATLATSGLTILAPRPSLTTSQPPLVSAPMITSTAANKVAEEPNKEVSSPNPAFSAVEEAAQTSPTKSEESKNDGEMEGKTE